MPSLQEQYDDAMFDFSTGDYDTAITKLQAVLAADPAHFDAQLALGMAHYRKGDYETAIAEGHKAEKMKPGEQLVHTNLSLFYMKAGDKKNRRASRAAGANFFLAAGCQSPSGGGRERRFADGQARHASATAGDEGARKIPRHALEKETATLNL